MDKEELIREVSETALSELEKMDKRYIQRSSPKEMLKELFRGMSDPAITPAALPFSDVNPLCVIEPPPDFPRLLASYGEKNLQYAIVRSFAEWNPIHHWFIVFPPQQPANRAVTTTLEAELEKLKSEGFTERPAEEWQRRKQTLGYTT